MTWMDDVAERPVEFIMKLACQNPCTKPAHKWYPVHLNNHLDGYACTYCDCYHRFCDSQCEEWKKENG